MRLTKHDTHRAMRLVRAASLTNFHAVAISLGLDPDRLLRQAGLSPAMLTHRDIAIPRDQVVDLLELAATQSGCDAFALRMAEARKLSNLGPVGLLIRDQSTVRDSLKMLLNYQRVFLGSISLEWDEGPALSVIRMTVHTGPGRLSRQACDLGIGGLVSAISALMPNGWRPRRVLLHYATPTSLDVHRRVLGAGVCFNQEIDGVVMTADELAMANQDADPHMADYARRLLESEQEALEVRPASQVRRSVLLLLPSGLCTAERVADHLGVATRTMQRWLADEGLSFSDLVHQLRLELADQHVRNSQRPLIEVAGLLGFSGSSAFSRWFQTQFGCSPSSARSQTVATG